MHYLHNLNMVMQSDVFRMSQEYFFEWDRIVDLMQIYAERANTVVEGADQVTNLDEAWKFKKLAMLAILESLCNLLKEEDKGEFFTLYWALKSYGMICMDFKDLQEALRVFRRLKGECHTKLMLRHKMVTYKQIGYVYRLMKDHLKATNAFKRSL